MILNLYVDDSTNSFGTVEIAMEFYEEPKPCLNEANFDLLKWATNSFELKTFIDSNENNSRSEMDVSDSETYAENLYSSSSIYRKVLGLNWDNSANDFECGHTRVLNRTLIKHLVYLLVTPQMQM